MPRPRSIVTPLLRRAVIGALVVALCLIVAAPARAHANLARSEPAANASLTAAPDALRLWFTEPPEPLFSRVILRDVNGALVETPPAEVDPFDPLLLTLSPGALPDGLYTVSWRVVSAADGHATEGSFAFGINAAVTAASDTAPRIDEATPADSVAIRWLNTFSYALLLGGLGFWLFVWRPADGATAAVERRLRRAIRAGWAIVGAALVLALLLQASLAAGANALLSGETFGAVGALLGGTAYGATWWLRAGLWLTAGVLLIFGDTRRLTRPVALGLGLAMLLAHALGSHSAAAPDPVGALAAHWLHLTAMSLWIGGLFAFALALPGLRAGAGADSAPLAGRLVAYFSNYARVAVALLAISGAFMAWLHISTLEALAGAAYGRALLAKTALFAPMLALAAVNLIWTGRRLAAGEVVWIGRLRALVSVEGALALGVLLGSALMTAGAPARAVQDARDAQPVAREQPSYFGMNVVDDQMIHLEIVPGFVGENTFIVNPYDADGEVITDAALIRLRFTHLEQNLGQSELRIEPDGLDDDGYYEVAGSNLSATGRWRVRMTVARPGQFDLVSDFEVDARLPEPPPARVIDASIPLRQRQLNMAAAGLALVGVALIFAAPKRRASGENLLALAGLAVGLVCLANAGALALDERRPAGALSVRDAFAYPALLGSTGGVFLTLENSTALGDRLIGAQAEVARTVELHRTVMDGDVASMAQQVNYDLPAGRRLDFAPGGDHLMLVDLHRDLRSGERFTITLQFASGRQLAADVTVR